MSSRYLKKQQQNEFLTQIEKDSEEEVTLKVTTAFFGLQVSEECEKSEVVLKKVEEKQSVKKKPSKKSTKKQSVQSEEKDKEEEDSYFYESLSQFKAEKSKDEFTLHSLLTIDPQFFDYEKELNRKFKDVKIKKTFNKSKSNRIIKKNSLIH